MDPIPKKKTTSNLEISFNDSMSANTGINLSDRIITQEKVKKKFKKN